MRITHSLLLPSLLLIVLILLLCGLVYYYNSGICSESYTFYTSGGTHTFSLRVASSTSQHAHGLMGVPQLAENEGMVFTFAADKIATFWMKDTLIPLDIIFVKADGSIACIHKNAIPFDHTIITCPHYVKSVVELNAGMCEKLDIGAGDLVRHAAKP